MTAFGDDEITPEMISAGWKVLDDSGIVEGYDASPSDEQVVREMYLAMRAADGSTRRTGPSRSLEP